MGLIKRNRFISNITILGKSYFKNQACVSNVILRVNEAYLLVKPTKESFIFLPLKRNIC